MDKCFVIQPFDEKYNKRFNDIYKPAINEAGFEAVRIDTDNSPKFIFEDIIDGIKESKICFAEISENNPNVWFEVGYAFACEKDVIMVCFEGAREQYPFDVRHMNIISYKNDSLSDFEKLKEDIINSIKNLNKRRIQK